MADFDDDLEAYGRPSDPSRSTVGRRLLKAASRLTEEIAESDKWLSWAWEKLEKKPNQQREDEWLEELRNYERLCDLREDIASRVLFV